MREGSVQTQIHTFGPVAVSDLVGPGVQDEMTLHLAKSPVYIARRDLEDGGGEYAVVLGQVLGRRALMDLLYVLAPYKAHGPDRFARVLDNWGIFDRAAGNGTSNALFMQHANSLGDNWWVFGEHRPVFISVFEDTSERLRVLPILTWTRAVDGSRRWSFEEPDERLLLALSELAPVLREAEQEGAITDPLVGLCCLPYFQPELHRDWEAWRPLQREGKSNYIGPASVPMMALINKRAMLNSRFIGAAQAVAEGETHG